MLPELWNGELWFPFLQGSHLEVCNLKEWWKWKQKIEFQANNPDLKFALTHVRECYECITNNVPQLFVRNLCKLSWSPAHLVHNPFDTSWFHADHVGYCWSGESKICGEKYDIIPVFDIKLIYFVTQVSSDFANNFVFVVFRSIISIDKVWCDVRVPPRWLF